jgi:hypothetical protein
MYSPTPQDTNSFSYRHKIDKILEWAESYWRFDRSLVLVANEQLQQNDTLTSSQQQYIDTIIYKHHIKL